MPSIEQLEKLLTIDRDDPFVHYGLGQEHAKLGDHQTAIECFDQTLRLDESYCYAYYFKAISQNSMGLKDGAIETISSGIERAKGSGDMKALSELEALLQSMR